MWLYRLTQFGQLIAIAVVVWSCLKTLHAQPTSGFLRVWFQYMLYYARYFMLWVMVWAFAMLMSPLAETLHWVTLLVALLYVYTSWIEPNRLQVNYTSISLDKSPDSLKLDGLKSDRLNSDNSKSIINPSLKVAVLSDIHVGIFSGNPHQLNRLIRTLNRLDVSAVLIAGDWLYHAGADILGQMVVFKALNKPCFTVFSEQDHNQIVTRDDSELDNQNELSYVLQTLGIQIMNGSSVTLEGVTLVGAGAKTHLSQNAPHIASQSPANKTTATFHPKLTTHQPLLILTHDIKNLAENANHLLNNDNPKLIIAGQTHGGQVYVPYLTNALVRAMTGTHERAGLSIYAPDRRSRYQVWTTTGIGMTGLPFRLNCPPSIDVLTLYL